MKSLNVLARHPADSCISWPLSNGIYVKLYIDTIRLNSYAVVSRWSCEIQTTLTVVDTELAMKSSKTGGLKILKRCTLPLTAAKQVNLIITDMEVIEVTPKSLVLKEMAPA